MSIQSKQLYFSDFTRENYRKLLQIAKSNYKFRQYDSYKNDDSFIIWRHDIDTSPNGALALAKIEADEDVKSIYFVHLHSSFYNLLERETTDRIRAIIDCGHSIGLHFDTAYYNEDNQLSFEKNLRVEAEFLEFIFKCKINSFSFHNPTEFANARTNSEYAGLINATSEYFRTVVGYCSDSNGYWRYRRLEDVLREASDKRLQVLTHPEWWQETVMSPKERMLRCIDGRAARTRQDYEAALKAFGRDNVDWDS